MNKKEKISQHILDEMDYHNRHSELLCEESKRDLVWQVPEKMIFIDRYISQDKNWTLLDLGCGTAENIKKNILPKMTAKDVYIGIDISKKLLNQARRNVPQGIFRQLPMGNIEMPKKSVDYISFFGALHHDENPKETLRKVSNFLRPGGLIFLREPQESAFKKGNGASPHEGGFNPTSLKKWLNESNFEILEWYFLNTRFFHLARRLLIKLKLGRWEEVESLWRVKVSLELIMEKFLAGSLKLFQGTDMFIVARKI